MIIGSHNSWSYLPVRRWWMRPLRFMAKCQRKTVTQQYKDYGVRCFDLRVRFEDGEVVLAHGIIEYKFTLVMLLMYLRWLNDKGDCMVRVVHEVRTKAQRERSEVTVFRDFCAMIEATYQDIRFWCGRNLYDWTVDYEFQCPDPTCEELYASVCPPLLR